MRLGAGTGRLTAMRQLLLLRHAKSSWDERELPDHERPLNPRGRRAAATMRDAMERLGLVPDLVLVSSSVRTVQTLEALEPWADTPLVDRMETLYNAPASVLLDTIHTVKETVRSVLVIAHNPGIHELAVTLVGPQALEDGYANADLRRLGDGYPSGALTEFTVNGPWQGLGKGGGRLIRFICPRDFAAEHASDPE